MAYYPVKLNSNLGGKEPVLIGSYSGNRSINVSTYLKTGNTKDNFMVVVTSVPVLKVDGGSIDTAEPSGLFSGISPSKSLSGNTLSVSGMSFYVRTWSGSADRTAYSNASYNLYYIEF